MNGLGVRKLSADAHVGSAMRAARREAGLGLSRMADLTHYSKQYLSQVETGVRAPTDDVVAKYEQALGVDMWRKDITHPKLLTVNREARAVLLEAVENGDPGPLRTRPTAHRTDVILGNHVTEAGAKWFRKWMLEGDTATLRTNALSVIAKLPGKENADLVVRVLESDEKVRRLIVASEISRMTQLDWETSLRAVDDPTIIPEPGKIASKLAKGAINPRGTEARWSCAYLLTRLVPVLGR